MTGFETRISGVRSVHLTKCATTSVNRLAILKVFCDNFFTKVAQKFSDFWGYFKNITFYGKL